MNRAVAGTSPFANESGEWMNEIIFQVADAPEGGFTAQALGASIYTEADSLPELREMVRRHFDEGQSPSFIRLHS